MISAVQSQTEAWLATEAVVTSGQTESWSATAARGHKRTNGIVNQYLPTSKIYVALITVFNSNSCNAAQKK